MIVGIDLRQYVRGNGTRNAGFEVEESTAEEGAVVVLVEAQFAAGAFQPGGMARRVYDTQVQPPFQVTATRLALAQRCGREERQQQGGPEPYPIFASPSVHTQLPDFPTILSGRRIGSCGDRRREGSGAGAVEAGPADRVLPGGATR